MKLFGMGLMRLPLSDENDLTSIDQEQVNQMVDEYIEKGYNYFDTAYPYHEGLSEVALRKAVIERYPREDVIIADKLPMFSIEKREQLEPIFNEQLERCGVDYFDYYMLHNVSTWTRKAVENTDAFQFIVDKKREGKIKHIGISLHDKSKFLKKILDEHPEIEFVQLQVNYLDWDSDSIEARKCCNLVKEYGKELIIMEPIKGGMLVNIPSSVDSLFKRYNPDISPVEWAFKFCAGLDPMVILSGVSSIEQMRDNLNIFENIKPLTLDESYMIGEASILINNDVVIPCTDCNYCIPACEHNIPIPKYIRLYNDSKREGVDAANAPIYYTTLSMGEEFGSAADCDACGECTKLCPQNIKIAKWLEKINEEFGSGVSL